MASRAEVVQGNVNVELPKFCSTLKRLDRALVFLDPYGMEVDWATLRSIAATPKIDLWLLVPLGQALIRILGSKKPSGDWAAALDRFLGSTDWRDEFYVQKEQETLFGPESSEVREVDFEKVASYVVSRLQEIFAIVLENPIILYNNSNVPIYMLCFAASNPRGAEVAKKIATSIARGSRNG